MGGAILKLDGKYIHWTSVSDSPKSPLLTKDQFIRYWRAEYGRNGWCDIDSMLEQADKTGCSARGHTVAEIIRGNRAGEKGNCLTKAQIIDQYSCDEEGFVEWSKIRDKAFEKMVKEFRKGLDISRIMTIISS